MTLRVSGFLAFALSSSAFAAPPIIAPPNEEAAKETTKKFLDAIGRGDDAEAKKFVLSPADCETIAELTGNKKPSDLAKCRDMLKDDPVQVVAHFHQSVPVGFVTGKIEVTPNSPGAGVDSVRAFAAKGDGKTGLMLIQIGTRTRVVVAKLAK
jgi:hypothetical protein